MPRIARIVGIGYYHHVIQRGNNRQTVFFNDADRVFYLSLLKKYGAECQCGIYAYCLMSNHIHLLIIPQKENSLAKAMQKISLRYTQHINSKYGRTGRLWECRFHSSIVDKEAYLGSVCRYIERNPVRAGIVDDPLHFVWSSSKVNMRGEKHDFVKSVWEDDRSRNEYARFAGGAEAEEELRKIRTATGNGKPIGNEQFVTTVAKSMGISLMARRRGRPWKKGSAVK